MRKILLAIIGFLIFIPSSIKADCSYQEKARLRSLANNLSFTYDYTEVKKENNSNSISFNITITNLNSDLYIDDYSSKKLYFDNPNHEITINGYNAGQNIEFAIYANKDECIGHYLISSIVSLPSYNSYYTDSVCNGISDYNLCQRFTKVNLSYEDFVSQVKTYKESLNTSTPSNNDTSNELIEQIIAFLSKYNYYLFGSIIIICGGLMYYLNKKDSFDLK